MQIGAASKERQAALSAMGKVRANTNPSFRFIVKMGNTPLGAFTECTLPTIELDVEELKEGGQNTYVHQLPGQRRSTKMTLKNGVGNDVLVAWYKEILSQQFSRRNLSVLLLDVSQKRTVMTWSIQSAYPIKWTGPQLNSGENSIAIQTLELACGLVTME